MFASGMHDGSVTVWASRPLDDGVSRIPPSPIKEDREIETDEGRGPIADEGPGDFGTVNMTDI